MFIWTYTMNKKGGLDNAGPSSLSTVNASGERREEREGPVSLRTTSLPFQKVCYEVLTIKLKNW